MQNRFNHVSLHIPCQPPRFAEPILPGTWSDWSWPEWSGESSIALGWGSPSMTNGNIKSKMSKTYDLMIFECKFCDSWSFNWMRKRAFAATCEKIRKELGTYWTAAVVICFFSPACGVHRHSFPHQGASASATSMPRWRSSIAYMLCLGFRRLYSLVHINPKSWIFYFGSQLLSKFTSLDWGI